MRVLVDTSVWSLALRWGAAESVSVPAQALRSLLADHRIQMIGPLRQELLSGIRDERQFDRLAKHLPLVLYRPEDLV